ncbi:hypothetical protein [Dactylosporangium sp. NPDC000521]|uniref:hypothetical protein n=1 Tax=Dactylosporangium sp. NPDC000521 TaxID=3363975 RepID=UPI003674ACFD
MTGTPTAPPVLVDYDTTGYPMLPATPPVPRVLRPAGGGGSPGPRRARLSVRSVAAAVAVLLVAAVAVRCSGIGPTESPESLVRALFAALTAHDGQRVDSLGWCERSPLCSTPGLTTGYQAPENVTILSSTALGRDQHQVKVRYTVGGTSAEESVGLTRHRSGMLGHRWGISELPGARLTVRAEAFDEVHVAGVTVRPNMTERSTTAAEPGWFAPPGAYTVAVDAAVPFAATTVIVVVAGGVDPPTAVITPTLSPDVQPAIEQQIQDRIVQCGKQQEFHPYPPQWRTFQQTCPFAHDPQSPFTKPPVWTVERLPTIMLRVDDRAVVSVKTTSPGIATVRYQWSLDVLEPRQWTDASKTVEFTVDGRVGVADNAPTWIG